MTGLTAWTGGLAGERDPAQPLLTLHDGPARVELSGATTANWVAKSANLLVDGLGAPDRVGLLLPLHWQAVSLLLAGVATGATVVVAAGPDDLAGCGAAFTTADRSGDALDAGADEVLALSMHPLGAPCGDLPPMVQDYAREVPAYGDGWSGPRPTAVRVEAGGGPLADLPSYDLSAADRVAFAGDLADPTAVAALLAVLRSGAALVLLPDPATVDLDRVVSAERVTFCWGVSCGAVPSLD